jgi:hypothetical protein
MNPQERQVIDGIFDRLKNVADQPRDAAAESYIAELVKKQPYATYALAQSVYVQEQALLNQQQQIEHLQAEIQQLQARPAAGGGFLSGLFGGGQPARPAAPQPGFGQRSGMMPGQPQGGPWGGQPQQAQPGPWGQPQRQGMGFLGTAAAAAAGVAGGMVLGSILSNALGGGAAQAAESQAQDLFGQEEQLPAEDISSDGGWDSGFDGGGDSFEA